jgi:hypothetical protein
VKTRALEFRMESPRCDQQVLELLNRHMVQVLALAKTCTTGLRVLEGDDFGFMAVNFLNKQIDHAGSLLLLIPRRDTCLIARTMFDGICQLRWAYQSAAERGRQWRAFSWVCDWRRMTTELASGCKVDDMDQVKIKAGIAEIGSMFRRSPSNSSVSSDPYHRHWRGRMHLSDMASAIGVAEDYEEFYASMSAWEHWDPGSFGDALSRRENKVTYLPESIRVSVQSMLLGIQTLLQTLEIVDAHLHLSNREKINLLRDSCVSDLESCLHPAG